MEFFIDITFYSGSAICKSAIEKSHVVSGGLSGSYVMHMNDPILQLRISCITRRIHRCCFPFIKGKAKIVIRKEVLIKKKWLSGFIGVYMCMSPNKKEFIENLDSVLEIFRQFKEILIKGNTKIDQDFIRNFDEIIQNYQIIREEIPDEMVSKFGMPIQVMALQLVEQLRFELEGQHMLMQEKKIEDNIDEKLRNPDLSEKEIDALLDQRLSVVK
jgi:hypothetical protein